MDGPGMTGRSIDRPVESLGIEQVEEIAARGKIYEGLSFLYGVPSEDFLKRGFLAPLKHACGVCKLGVEGDVGELENYLAGLSEVTPVGKEYVRLFRGPGKAVVYPYESMHVDGEIMGPSTLAVLERYREGGLAPSEDFRDLPDHISAELEFMYFLCAMELECCHRLHLAGRLKFNKLQEAFFAEHLAKWVPRFAEESLGNTSSPFYRSSARILQTFLRREAIWSRATDLGFGDCARGRDE